MKRKLRLKRSAKNPFTKLTGIQAIQVNGGTECLVVEQETMLLPSNIRHSQGQKLTKVVAALLYLRNRVAVSNKAPSPYTKVDDIMKVKQVCGVKNCVAPQHLEVTLQEDKRTW